MTPRSVDRGVQSGPAVAVRQPVALPRWGRAVAFAAALALLFGGLLLWLFSRPDPGQAPMTGALSLDATDYAFSPDRIGWRAGQQVTITLTNGSEGRPGKVHEFMVGRRPVMKATAFGARPAGGFQTDFFDQVSVRLLRARGLSMVMPGGARISGPAAPASMGGGGMKPAGTPSGGMKGKGMKPSSGGGMQMGGAKMGGAKMGGMQMGGAAAENGLMLELQPGGSVTFSFVVPDRPGRWELACFRQNGEHYTNGMKGVVTVDPMTTG